MPLSPTVPGRSLPVTTTVCRVVPGCRSCVATSTRPAHPGPEPKYTSPCPGRVLEKLTVKEATLPCAPGTDKTAGMAVTRGVVGSVAGGITGGVAGGGRVGDGDRTGNAVELNAAGVLSV